MTHPEIAKLLSVSEGTVRSHVSDALITLRDGGMMSIDTPPDNVFGAHLQEARRRLVALMPKVLTDRQREVVSLTLGLDKRSSYMPIRPSEIAALLGSSSKTVMNHSSSAAYVLRYDADFQLLRRLV